MQSHCIFGGCLVEVWTQMTTATPKRLIHAAMASHLFPRASFLAIADARSVAKSRGLTEPPSFDVLKAKEIHFNRWDKVPESTHIYFPLDQDAHNDLAPDLNAWRRGNVHSCSRPCSSSTAIRRTHSRAAATSHPAS